MKLIAFLMLSLLLGAVFINAAYAEQSSRKVESITIPYTAANADRKDPAHYFFQSKHIANWILNIRNELLYNSDNPEAKVVIRLKEDPANENYVEIAMSGAPKYIFWAAVANNQVGYMRLYQNERSWSRDQPVSVSFIENDKLSIHDGVRNVVDRLNIGPFVLNTVEVYGKDSADAAANALEGKLVFDVISGNPLENPIMMIPVILAAAAGGTVVTLIKLKKRT